MSDKMEDRWLYDRPGSDYGAEHTRQHDVVRRAIIEWHVDGWMKKPQAELVGSLRSVLDSGVTGLRARSANDLAGDYVVYVLRGNNSARVTASALQGMALWNYVVAHASLYVGDEP